MKNIKTQKDLRAAIVELENAQKEYGSNLKQEVYSAFQKIQPINIIKSTVKEAIKSRDLKENLVDASIGVAAGYVSKALFEGKSHSPTRKLMETILMFSVTNLATKNPGFVTTISTGFINMLKNFSINKNKPKHNNLNDKDVAEFEK